MPALLRSIQDILAAQPLRVVLSAARGGEWRRATATRLKGGWQLEKRSATQAFHQNLTQQELAEALADLLQTSFGQLTAQTGSEEYGLRLTKKGRVLTNRHSLASSATRPAAAAQAPSVPTAHDRPKRRLLPEGTALAPLVDIGVMTQSGHIVAAKRDKYRQINRFLELVDDVLPDDISDSLRILEFGCGKSALSFLLYHDLSMRRGLQLDMLGLDLKESVVESCNAAALRYGYHNLRFAAGDIADYTAPGPVDMVITLHACDTATDLALAKAVGWGAKWILSVPCCQHELNAQLQSDELHLLARYGIVKERTAALMTDAIRANLLAACGYKTQLVEFVGFEHTPKNIMIRAVQANTPLKVRTQALNEVRRLCEAFHLTPMLETLLRRQGALG